MGKKFLTLKGASIAEYDQTNNRGRIGEETPFGNAGRIVCVGDTFSDGPKGREVLVVRVQGIYTLAGYGMTPLGQLREGNSRLTFRRRYDEIESHDDFECNIKAVKRKKLPKAFFFDNQRKKKVKA